MATKRVNIDIVAKDKSQRALQGVRGSLDKLKSSVFNVRNALAGLGGGLVIRNLVNTGKEIESLQVRLKFLFGSAEEGAKAFDEMAQFAAKVPFSLEQIQQGAGVLSVVSKDADELADILEITGNVAAVTGLDFRTASEQIQRSLSAGIASADLFREKGVRDLLGFKAGATVTAEETAEAFERVFGKGGRFGGATDELAQTLEGTLSMIGDKVFNFKKTLLDAGFFAELKNQFGDLDNFLQENAETLDEVATSIGKGLAEAVVTGANAIIFLKDNFNTLVEAVKLLIAFKIAGVFIALAGGILKANSAMLLFNATIKRNLFIAGAAIVISQFDKILEMLGKMPSDFDNASAAIAHNNEQINHYTKQLSLAEQHLKNLQNQYGDTKIKEFADQIQDQKDLIEEISTKLSGFKETNDEIFKDSYPVYEDKILRMVGALKKESDAVKENSETKKTINSDFLNETLDELRKEQEAIDKHNAEIQEILNQNKLDSIAIFYEMQEEKERINNEFKVKEINDEIAHQQRLKEVSMNNQHKMFDDAHANKSKMAKMEEESKKLTIDKGRELVSELAKNNKEMFMINKALAIKDAVVSTSQGVAKALSTGNIPLALIIGGLGAVQIAKIASQQYQGRAGGGSVNKGQAYMVGEKGAEMFVPSGSGKIVPNNQMGSNKPVNVNFNINTVDARGFNELLTNSRGVIVNMINSAVNETGRQAIV